MSIRILLADDHQIFREGLRSLLEKQPEMKVVAEAGDGRAAVKLAQELRPDVVVMDITMPDLNGIEATRQIMAQRTQTRVIALSMHSNSRFMAEVLKAGASAYVLKDGAVAELIQAIQNVAAGRAYLSPRVTEKVVDDYVRRVPVSGGGAYSALTPREREVLQLIAEGKATKDMAAHLHVSVKTVEAYRSQIMDKLHIHNVAGLTKFAIHEGLTSPEP